MKDTEKEVKGTWVSDDCGAAPSAQDYDPKPLWERKMNFYIVLATIILGLFVIAVKPPRHSK